MPRLMLIIVGYITVLASWEPVDRADGYMLIVRSNQSADTIYTTDTCFVVSIVPYRVHECLVAAYNDEGDTSSFGNTVYCIGFGHDSDSESRVVFSVDSLSLIMAVDFIAEFHMMTGEDFIGFYIRGERDYCPVVRKLRE